MDEARENKRKLENKRKNKIKTENGSRGFSCRDGSGGAFINTGSFAFGQNVSILLQNHYLK